MAAKVVVPFVKPRGVLSPFVLILLLLYQALIARQRFDYAIGNLVLKRQWIGTLAIEMLGPDVLAVSRVDQLRDDPQFSGAFLNAALQDVAHSQLFADLSDIDGFAFVGVG